MVLQPILIAHFAQLPKNGTSLHAVTQTFSLSARSLSSLAGKNHEIRLYTRRAGRDCTWGLSQQWNNSSFFVQ